jgi:hypothetical protein
MNSTIRKLKQGWIFVVMFFLVVIFAFFKKHICLIVRKKYFLKGNTSRKELIEENMMREVGINMEDEIVESREEKKDNYE